MAMHDDLASLSRRELQALAKARGIKANQRSELIIQEIKRMDDTDPSTEEAANADIAEQPGVEEAFIEEAAVEEATIEEGPIEEATIEEATIENFTVEEVVPETAVVPDPEEAAVPPVEHAMTEAKGMEAISTEQGMTEPAQAPKSEPRQTVRSATKPWEATPFVPLKSVKPLTKAEPFSVGRPGSTSLSERGITSVRSIEVASRKKEVESQRAEESAARKAAAVVRRELVTAKFKAESTSVPVINGKPVAAWDLPAAKPLQSSRSNAASTKSIRQSFKKTTTALGGKAAERKRAERKSQTMDHRRAAVQTARSRSE